MQFLQYAASFLVSFFFIVVFVVYRLQVWARWGVVFSRSCVTMSFGQRWFQLPLLSSVSYSLFWCFARAGREKLVLHFISSILGGHDPHFIGTLRERKVKRKGGLKYGLEPKGCRVARRSQYTHCGRRDKGTRDAWYLGGILFQIGYL